MKRPDFFLVGAPKCGTTAMNEYFRQHPELFVPDRQKDLAFFGEDLHRSKPREPLPQYLDYYEPALSTQRAGEVCVWYLYSEAAAREIRDFSPNAQILIMLRDPVEMVHSQHSQLVYSRDEDITDFEQALDAEPERRAGSRIPPATGNRIDEGLYYTFLGDYASHVERYMRMFGRDRTKVILYDDFRRDTASVVQDVFAFLGVDPVANIDFRVINSNKVPRSNFAQRLLREPPPRLEAIYRAITPARAHGKLIPFLLRANTRYQSRSPLAPDLAVRLRRQFRPDIDRLGALVDRDLSAWGVESESSNLMTEGAVVR